MENKKIYDILMELCEIRSISETGDENGIVSYLEKKVQGFKKNYGNLMAESVAIKNDKFHRNFFYALFQNENSKGKTVILLSHHDVVSVGDYGKFKELAFSPEKYTELLKSGNGPVMNTESEEDLKSGDWIFGRGTMDMKFGLAMSVETLRLAVEEGQFENNILLLSVPDEEANSVGMLGSIETLLKLRNEKGLEYCGTLIPEPFFNKIENDPNRYIYTGVVGKLLPVVLAVGKEAHSCEPLSGLSAASLISEFVSELELSPELMDSKGEFITPPPVCLKIGDLREGYSVSLIGAAYAYFNIMTIDKNPDQVMAILKAQGARSFEKVLNRKKTRILDMNKEYNGESAGAEFTPKVWSFSELTQACKAAVGKEFDSRMAEVSEENGHLDPRELTIKMMMEAVKLLPEKEPMLIISYGPPFYPHTKKTGDENSAVKVAQKVSAFAEKEFGFTLLQEAFYPGLSDMSYLGLERDFSAEALSENFPMWEKGYDLPLFAIKELNIPFICLGPWGKDAHKYTERLNFSYSFGKVPRIFHQAIKIFGES